MSFELIENETYKQAKGRKFVLLYKDDVYEDYDTIKEVITVNLKQWTKMQNMSMDEICFMIKDVDTPEDDTTWKDFVIGLAKEFDCGVKLMHRNESAKYIFDDEDQLDSSRRYFMASHLASCGDNPVAIIFNSKASKGNTDTKDMMVLMTKFNIKLIAYEYNKKSIGLFGKYSEECTTFEQFIDSGKVD